MLKPLRLSRVWFWRGLLFAPSLDQSRSLLSLPCLGGLQVAEAVAGGSCPPAGTALETRATLARGRWAGFSSPSHTSSWGKVKGGGGRGGSSISDYFVPLAVRMGCLFVLGGLPERVGFFSFSFRNEIFLKKLPVRSGFFPPACCGLGAGVHTHEG